MKYKVTCLNCKQSELIHIEKDTNIIWGQPKYIISGRKRLDMQWGWQCFCGNNSIMTKQERRVITDTANPDPKEINEIIKNLETDTQKKFVMVRA